MKYILCVALTVAITLGVAARPGRPVAKRVARSTAPQWTVVVTTNELNQITKIASRTTTNGVQTVTLIENGYTVPLKYRAKWHTLSEEDKGIVMSLAKPKFYDVMPITMQLPKTEKEQDPTDDRVSAEVRETRVRW